MKQLLSILAIATLLTTTAFAATQSSSVFVAPGRDQKAEVHTYTDLLGGNVGQDISVPSNVFKSVQVTSVSGTVTVTLKGSNDGVTYVTLNDTTSATAALSFSAAGLKGINERTLYIRPEVSGTAGTAATVKIFVAK